MYLSTLHLIRIMTGVHMYTDIDPTCIVSYLQGINGYTDNMHRILTARNCYSCS